MWPQRRQIWRRSVLITTDAWQALPLSVNLLWDLHHASEINCPESCLEIFLCWSCNSSSCGIFLSPTERELDFLQEYHLAISTGTAAMLQGVLLAWDSWGGGSLPYCPFWMFFSSHFFSPPVLSYGDGIILSMTTSSLVLCYFHKITIWASPKYISGEHPLAHPMECSCCTLSAKEMLFGTWTSKAFIELCKEPHIYHIHFLAWSFYSWRACLFKSFLTH